MVLNSKTIRFISNLGQNFKPDEKMSERYS